MVSDLEGTLIRVGTHVFIDETKAKGYLVVAAMCPDTSLQAARRTIGRLVLPGQRSIHMKREGARRRSTIADAVAGVSDIGVTAVVLDAGRGPEPEHVRRERALREVVGLAATESVAHLVLDLDQTLVAKDARTIALAIGELDATSITYSHQSLATQPLLSIPDVIAWCWARGGEWRRRVMPIVSTVREV